MLADEGTDTVPAPVSEKAHTRCGSRAAFLPGMGAKIKTRRAINSNPGFQLAIRDRLPNMGCVVLAVTFQSIRLTSSPSNCASPRLAAVARH